MRSPRLLFILVPLLSACAGHRGWFLVPDEAQSHPGAVGQALRLEPDGTCPSLDGPGPVLVMVHGFGGETSNVSEVRDVLTELEPAAMLAFHWNPIEETRPLVARFAAGLTHLTQCTAGERPVVVVAHSAGGVLSSLALSEVTDAEVPHKLVLVTVASPLAGAGFQSWRLALLPVAPFGLTVAGKLRSYEAPRPGVHVVHVRTHPAGDHVMRPLHAGHLPDDPKAVVPGATEHSLPEHVGHDEALLWAARAIVEKPESFGLSRAVND